MLGVPLIFRPRDQLCPLFWGDYSMQDKTQLVCSTHPCQIIAEILDFRAFDRPTTSVSMFFSCQVYGKFCMVVWVGTRRKRCAGGGVGWRDDRPFAVSVTQQPSRRKVRGSSAVFRAVILVCALSMVPAFRVVGYSSAGVDDATCTRTSLECSVVLVMLPNRYVNKSYDATSRLSLLGYSDCLLRFKDSIYISAARTNVHIVRGG